MKTFLLLIISLATAAAAQKIAGGPYVVGVTSRTATVVWLVQSDEVTLRAPGAEPRTSPSLRVEKTTLTGLKPNTRYEYDVSGQDAGKGSFKTPPSGAGAYDFVVYGDTRTRPDVHRNVMNAMVKHGIPDFVLHTGDLVADGNDSSLWPVFFDIEKELLRQTSFFPSLGNHERNSRDYYDFFQVTTPYYSFEWGNGHFIVLNSDIGNVASSERAQNAYWEEQTRWLEEDLRSHQDADYRFVIAHHPPFTAVARRQGDNPHMTALVPMFEKYRVTAAFFGHDHNYQHYLKNGIHYVITGGGGAPLYDVDKPADGITVKVVSVEHFVTVRVDGKIAHIEAIGVDGRKLDEIEVHAGAGR
jgi:hypothetical protein